MTDDVLNIELSDGDMMVTVGLVVSVVNVTVSVASLLALSIALMLTV